MAMLLISCSTIAAAKISVLAREDADEAKTHLILYNERVCPLNSLALDFTRQLTGGSTYRGLSAEQLLLSIPYAPELWSEQELLHIGNTTLKKRLGITTDRARIKDFFTPSGEYRLKQLLDEENSKPTSAQDASLIEAIHTADEQIALFESDVKGTLIQPYRGTDISMTRIKAEILYNTIRALIPPVYLPKTKDIFPFGVSIILAILGYITLANLWKNEKPII
jgi:hypothetical protein